MIAEEAARLVEVHGVVQGVGFRPFVWRLANRLGMDGWVRNAGGVVQIWAEGPPSELDEFCAALRAEAPALARVEAVEWTEIQAAGVDGFHVDESLPEARSNGRLVSPDVATCPDCLRELFDPTDRRYGYPFINCTNCGPRFTIIESLPYDRARTSMRAFPLCDACAREYEDPSDRRFHAEPIACPSCGPTLQLLGRDGTPLETDPIEGAAALLRDGRIVALKGLGGFHLACDATDDAVVAALRRRKARPDKPFAVVVADLAMAHDYFDLSAAEASLLASPNAPIVLVADRGKLAAEVAPGYRRQGAMLPSTPLHHLLLGAVGRPLVLTSGNRSEEPICISNQEAKRRLSRIADAFLVHDRDIVARYDDSVTRLWGEAPIVLRRARSYAPSPIALAVEVAPTLGAGALLHGAFCLAEGPRAFLSQHLGDIDSVEALGGYRDALERYRRLFGIEPQVVAHDLHPDFLTTRFAEETGLPRVAVQHHHAHVAAVMAEHGLDGRVIGVAFDGFGLGHDGTAWGGEFLVADWGHAERAAHLRGVRQPGGDAAVRYPVRMALAHAADAGVEKAARRLMGADRARDEAVAAQLRSGLGSPWTSSAGRLFDSVAALTGVCRRATYEGQPAILLEQAADGSATREYGFELEEAEGELVVDTRPIIAAVVRDLTKNASPGEVAGRFHRTIAAMVVAVCRILRGRTGLERVALAGGVFDNALLVSDTAARLHSCGFRVFTAREAPAGDGGIALGQVLVAHARLGGDG